MKLKVLILSLVIALVSACAATSAVASKPADGYTFGQEEFFRPSQTIEIVTYDSEAELRRAARRWIARDPTQRIRIFGLIYPDKCVIHMLKPSVDYQPEWLGHELTHCVYGRWHKASHTKP